MADRVFPQGDWDHGDLGERVHTGRLDAAIDELVNRPESQGRTHGLLIVANGRVVREWNGEGFTPESTHISWSMAKSITHALVGIAAGDGLLSLDDRHLIPEWQNDERSKISLHDLLTMRSGLKWIEDYVDGTASDVIEMLFGESDFTGNHAAYAAAKPLLHEPGTQWVYSSGTTNIVARILANALGEKSESHDAVEDFMRTRLFAPLGMSAIPKFDTAGTFVGSSFLYATTRDFAKFGYLYLNSGKWGENQILPIGWSHDAARSVVHDDVTGMGYSSHWWTWPTDAGSMIAHGYEGQLTWVSPLRDVVVVHVGKTSADYSDQLRRGLERIVVEFPAYG